MLSYIFTHFVIKLYNVQKVQESNHHAYNKKERNTFRISELKTTARLMETATRYFQSKFSLH